LIAAPLYGIPHPVVFIHVRGIFVKQKKNDVNSLRKDTEEPGIDTEEGASDEPLCRPPDISGPTIPQNL